VTLDHPFLFVIRDTITGAIVFTAQVVDPTAS
jgi:serine protease inhibitor